MAAGKSPPPPPGDGEKSSEWGRNPLEEVFRLNPDATDDPDIIRERSESLAEAWQNANVDDPFGETDDDPDLAARFADSDDIEQIADDDDDEEAAPPLTKGKKDKPSRGKSSKRRRRDEAAEDDLERSHDLLNLEDDPDASFAPEDLDEPLADEPLTAREQAARDLRQLLGPEHVPTLPDDSPESVRQLLERARRQTQEVAESPSAEAPTEAPRVEPSDELPEPAKPQPGDDIATFEEAPQDEPDAEEADDDRPLMPAHPANDRQEEVSLDNQTIVEALLFSTETPLPLAKLAELAELKSGQVKKAMAALNERYRQLNTCFRVEEVADGFQMLTLPHFSHHVQRLRASRAESKLSPSALESLAIVAYKQPITRAAIEAIRGVSSGEVLRSLMDRGLVKMVGRAEELGRPMLYGTTKRFLRVFGLSSLRDLPMPKKKDEPKEGDAPADATEPESNEQATSSTDVKAEAEATADDNAPPPQPTEDAAEDVEHVDESAADEPSDTAQTDR